MITDHETDTLYLSPLLEQRYPEFFRHFNNALNTQKIEPHFLPFTKDIWCVDFMPIQIRQTEFVQFLYLPRYLAPKKYQKSISDPAPISRLLGITAKTTDIVADGGNVVHYKNTAVMTSRVLAENPKYILKELTRKLTDLLEVDKLILIPEQPHDFTGHSDGMLRFLDEHTLLVNDYSKEPDPEFQIKLKAVLKRAKLEIIEIPTSMYENDNYDDASGNYINFLQMKGVIFLPVFDRPADKEVVRQFEHLFPASAIVPVLCNELAVDGGLLKCISWNIRMWKTQFP